MMGDEGDNPWDVTVLSPQHEHRSDDEKSEGDEEMDGGGARINYNIVTPSTSDAYPHRAAQELHHRATAASRIHQRSNGSRPTAANATHRPTTTTTTTTTNRTNTGGGTTKQRKRWKSLLRSSVAVCLVGYFVLMVQQSSVLSDWESEQDSAEANLPPFDRRGMSATRFILEKNRVEERRKAFEERERSCVERQQYTRPPLPTTEQSLSWYSLASMMYPKSRQQVPSRTLSGPAAVTDLCGPHAKNASVFFPNSYRAQDTLNFKSRVMITGILNPIGFHLALTLRERCGVQVMTGIDPMFPNTVSHRLSLQERIQLLTTNIPKLIQPIVLPLVGLDPRANKNQKNEPTLLPMTGELSLLNFRPTHIVHLASYAPSEYMDPLYSEYSNQQSPYVSRDRNAPMYRIRSSLVSMEQILASVSNHDQDTKPPHLTYITALPNSHPDPLHLQLKHADEMLAATYHALSGNTYSVGLRLPNTIYGPWGRSGTSLYEMADTAVEQWKTSSSVDLRKQSGSGNATNHDVDLLYVSDAVDAIIAAMQFRSETQSPILLEVSPESRMELSSAASVVQDLMRRDVSPPVTNTNPPPQSDMMKLTQSSLQWKPSTTFRNGAMKTLAWHLDKEADTKEPAGHSLTTPGDVFLKEQGVATCAADDNLCHSGRKNLPCISECATMASCIPSTFDDIADLTREVTKGCDLVLYTQSLGYDVKDIKLHAQYSDEGEQIVCNFAFIPRESTLVEAVIKKVPTEQLKKFGLSTAHVKNSKDLREVKREGLNGCLLYKGWILIWVKDSTKPLSPFDSSLLKLNPGNLFSKDVKKVLFVDEKFPVSPNLEDVLFLLGEAHRNPIGYRAVYRKEDDGKKHKYKLQPEPERRAVMLLAPLKQRASKDTKESALADGQKLTVYTATKYMRYEIGEDASLSEGPIRKKQREFYERVPTFINGADMRSPDEPWYRYQMKHWVRTRWLVHDMHLDESRDLRCEWYQEHVQWGNDLDQLSFSHVMARRELERRIAHQEPDDHIKPPHVEHPELKLLTDAHEWHPYMGKEHRLDSLGKALEKVPEHMASEDDEEDGEVESKPVDKTIHGNAVPLFVRIMSERVMMFARQEWAKKKDKKPQKKKRRAKPRQK